MGVYLNPGKDSFEEEAVRSEIFVDKSMMIEYLNTVVRTNRKYVCVSRPRRFGKTMAADMICAYYDRTAESRKIFEELKISEGDEHWDRYLGRFDVIHLVMTDFMEESDNVQEFLDYLTEEVANELLAAFPDIKYGARINLRTVMSKIFAATGRQFIVVIDEWDAVLRIWKDDKEGQVEYLNFLRNWLKNKNYIALAYMTGILPIKKYGEHSALNMFYEYSMTSPKQMAEYTGFTDEEVRKLCDRYNMSYDDISEWYDGYVLSGIIPVDKREEYRQGNYTGNRYSIYSPLSVVTAVTTGVIGNYWNNTESYEALAEYIRKDYDGLKDTVALLMNGGNVRVNLSTYQNDMTTFSSKDDVLALLIHLGYLGFIPAEPESGKGSDYGEAFIPNREVLEVFKASTATEEWTPAFRAFEKSKELVKATWDCDEKKVSCDNAVRRLCHT